MRAVVILVAAAVMTDPVWAASAVPSPAAQAQAVRPAEPGPRARGAGRARGATAGRTVAEVEQMFDRYVLGQARQALRLEPPQLGEFAPRLQRLQALRRRALRQRQALVRELGDLTRPDASADENVIAAKLQALEAQAARSEQEVKAAYDRLEEVLTVEQRARWRVFEQRMERRKLELIAQARRQVREQTAADENGPDAPLEAAGPDGR